MNRFIALVCGAAIAASSSPSVRAAVIYWQNATMGNLISNNYSDGALTNLTPGSGDIVNFGSGGTATHSVPGTLNLQKLRVGHNLTPPGGTGTGNVTINNGAVVNLTVGASGAANASLWVGTGQNGTLNIDGAATKVTAARLIIIGYGNNVNRNGTVNITNGATLTATLGNINLGESTGGANEGIQGILNVNGNVSIPSGGSDLVIGTFTATSSVTQTGGLISVDDRIEVGSGANNGSSFNISNGTTTHGGSFFVGLSSATNTVTNISGGILNTGTRFLVGGGTSTGNVVNHSAGTLNTTLDLRVGDTTTGTSTYNFSGGNIKTLTGGIVGRQGTAKFFHSGGDADFGGTLAIGLRDGASGANNGLYEISGGKVVATALNIAPNGVGEFRVVGDGGLIDINGAFAASNTANGLATLSYKLQTGESLSLIDVLGAATFAAGTSLVLDASSAAPGQLVYDLLTAATITDNGLAFTGPSGWVHRIVSGGNGQILQAAFVPEPTSFVLAIVSCAAVSLARRRRVV